MYTDGWPVSNAHFDISKIDKGLLQKWKGGESDLSNSAGFNQNKVVLNILYLSFTIQMTLIDMSYLLAIR